MITNHLGYIFEGRKDVKGNIGVMESYDIAFSGDVQQVTITLSTDIKGNPLIPAYSDSSLGFRPLTEMFNDAETSDATIYRFTKSNKPYFGVLGTFVMLCEIKVKFNKETGEVLEEPTVFFYAPKNAIDSMKVINGKDVPAINCDRLSVSSGLNTIEINDKLLEAYKVNVLKAITQKNTTSRDVYLLARTVKPE